MTLGQPKPVLVGIAGLVPPVSQELAQRGLRVGVLLRWIAIGLIAATLDSLRPRPGGMALLLVAVVVYNAATMVAAFRAPVRWARRLAFAITVCDGVISVSYLGLYSSQIGTEALGGYLLVIVEGLAYFGVLGAALALAVFCGAVLVVQGANLPLFRYLFDRNGFLGGMLLLVLPTICILAVLHLRIAPARDPSPAPDLAERSPDGAGPRLSRREREVLGLVAAGYSNPMIANRLGLSDTTVKSYVENLLLRLDARNRAEAVAAASRLNLL